MADDEDSSSASDDAGDHDTYMVGEVRCVAGGEADESYVSALTDLSIREEGKRNGSSDVEHNDSEDDDDDDAEYHECFEEMPKSDGDEDHIKYTDGLDSDPMLRDHSFTKQTDIKEEYAEEMCNTIAGEEEVIEVDEEEKEERQQENSEILLTFPKAKSNDFSSKSPQVPVSPVSADKLPQIYLGQQSANHAKLDHLSKTTCQDIMREILKHINPRGKENQHLQNILKEWEKTLNIKRKGSQNVVLSHDEKVKLFCKTVTYDKLDMSVMYKIAKNLLQDEIMSLSGSSDRWEVDPPDYDVSLQACIEKLRRFRNQLSHSTEAIFSDEATRNNFQYIRDVIVQIEKHIGIDPQYSLQVDFIQNAQLSSDVAELQIKLEELESERDALKDAAKNELEKVRQNLEECLKKYCDALGMFNKNVNGQDAQTRKCIENHEGSDRFYVETKASKEAMDVLKSKHNVLITGNKGSGKTSLAYHLMYKLMPLGRCTVHVLDSLDIRHQKINTDGFVIALIELNEIKEKQRADLNFIISELISPNIDLSLYIIMTTMSHNVDEIADLTTQVDLSNVKEFALDEQEKRSILEQHLKQVVKKTGVPLLHPPTQDELTGIVKEPSYPISFPLAASLFAKNEKYRRLGPTFFRSPVDYFLSEIESLCKAKATFVLLLHIVFQDVTDIINSDDIRTWITDLELDVDPKSTEKAGKRVNGHLTLSCRSHIGFQLRNQCVRKAFAVYLAKKHLQRAMTCLDQEYIVDTSILSCRAENTGRCVQLLSEDYDKKLLARRFFREILADKTKHLSKSDAWLDDTFIELSIEVLVQHIRGTKEDDKVTEASSCIDKLYHWAVSHRCMLLCKSLRKYIDDTFVFDTLPHFTEQLMKRFMLVACTTTRDTLCIADKEITKIELLRFFVEQGSRCNFCTPMVECKDDEGLHYLLREGVLDPQPDWGFWDFLHTAASEGDTLLCNYNFVKLLSHQTEDIAISKENEGIAEFAKKVKSLQDDSYTSKRHFFFSCIETVGLNQSLMRAMKQHQFAILDKNEKGYNGLHVAVTSTLPDKRVRNTITVLALTELDLQQHVNKEGETPLMMAVQLPNCGIQRIAELLRQNADPNYASRDKCGHTALHLCIMSSLDDETVSIIVSTLIEHNADITKRSLSGETPISLAISKGKARLKTLGSLVKGRDAHAHATQYMLHYCIQLDLADNDKEEVVKVLIREGVSVNQKNDKGLTPIMVAIQKTRDNADLVRQLLDENADVTITDNEGLSPLHHCCKAPHTSDVAVKIGQWLLQRDQSGIESPDKKRKTPLMYAIMNENHTTSELVFDLIEKVTDVNAVDSGGNTVMHLSMASHFEDDIAAEIAERLMTKAADPFVLNNYSQSSPMCGLSSPKVHLKSISRILEKTAGDSFRPCKDIRGRNLLHLCVDAADVSDEDASTICKQAIMCGESVHERSKESKSPLEMAVSSKSVRLQTICSMLSSSGLKLTCEIYDMLKQANKLSYEFLQLLLQQKIDLDEVCRDSKFPYHDITDESQTEVDETIVLSLIRLGFDINKTNPQGDSAIMAACRFRCTDAILLALGRESDLTKLTNEKETYLHLLSKSNRSDLETRDAMKSLMKIAPVNVNHLSRKQRSALAESVIKQKKDTVQFLIHKGADHNQKDRAGKTSIHHCVEGDWFDDKACAMLDILIKDKTNFVDMLDNSSASALDLASSHESHSRLFTILRLLELGSDVETVDQSGKSPIQNCLTHLRGHRKSVVLERTCRLTMLRVYGVHPFSKDDDGNTALYICDKPEWRNRLQREKRILQANMMHVPALFEEVVKSSFASLSVNDTFSHVEYPVKKLTPRVLDLMKYSSKLLHREVFDVYEDDADFDTLSDFLEIREFEAR
ncbi:uncharacterized protein LOC110458503 [Mizuhopecten yessoensis]|uniref:Ankyrin repeat protein n=1 Tax=Mizuhopecten yessoensis TaxID=6573 RepID=A0A210Q6P5_MIZYE|nr:uncharacterized protein LOC110458503 [Mizuhopecten yessoensis]XP_021365908.1 uncharacterized protein LOC110458503 [Mizuhopecten yessoensis]OWF44359.1 Ankyrin repeat protein [Mizuhopecten yessoensis]